MGNESEAYEQFEACLTAAGSDSGAAEAHGLLCGSICAGGRMPVSAWMEHLLGEENTLSAAAQDCNRVLEEMQTDILRSLHDDTMGFMPLLPADSAPLSRRVLALGRWCTGFLYGMALGGVRDEARLPDNVQEILRDFYEIANASAATDGRDEADEAAYVEIVEYVRMGVLLACEELQPATAPARLQ